MIRAVRVLAALLCTAAACAGGSDVPPAPDTYVDIVTDRAVTDFYSTAQEFYDRLEGRRFNSITTFRDAYLHEFFRAEEDFSNYYADLAHDLVEASFRRNLPLGTSVQEFLVDGPGRARVRVRIWGKNALPLRPWRVAVQREDRWERHEGRWWIIPGAL